MPRWLATYWRSWHSPRVQCLMSRIEVECDIEVEVVECDGVGAGVSVGAGAVVGVPWISVSRGMKRLRFLRPKRLVLRWNEGKKEGNKHREMYALGFECHCVRDADSAALK